MFDKLRKRMAGEEWEEMMSESSQRSQLVESPVGHVNNGINSEWHQELKLGFEEKNNMIWLFI